MNQTRSNRTQAYFLFVFICALLTLSGCKNPKPTPVETYGTYGNGTNPELIDGTNTYGDYAGGTDINGDFGAGGTLDGGDGMYGAGQDGLQGHDGMSMDGGIEGLLPSVFFDYDTSAVRPEDRPKLQSAAEFLAANPGDRLKLEGHCDWRGTAQYNMALGERRANAVFQYLTALGVSASRLEVVSKGDIEAATEASDGQMAQDRRVDLIVLR